WARRHSCRPVRLRARGVRRTGTETARNPCNGRTIHVPAPEVDDARTRADRFTRRPGGVREIPRGRHVHCAGAHRSDASSGSRSIKLSRPDEGRPGKPESSTRLEELMKKPRSSRVYRGRQRQRSAVIVVAERSAQEEIPNDRPALLPMGPERDLGVHACVRYADGAYTTSAGLIGEG